MPMHYEEDAELGTLTVYLGHTVQYWRTMHHHDRLGLWVAYGLNNTLRDFQTWHTKRQAETAARALGYTANHVYEVGSNFSRRWGIRHDFRDNYFLAKD